MAESPKLGVKSQDSPDGVKTPYSRSTSMMFDRADSITDLVGRMRHGSGNTSLDITPLPHNFDQEDLDNYLSYFRAHKIKPWKIWQHLTGTHSVNENGGVQEVNNFEVNAASVDKGWTALHWACAEGDKNLLIALIKSSADPRIESKTGSTPIHFAISYHQSDIVHLLLKYDRGLVESVNEIIGFYPLHTAARFRDIESAKLLIEFGARVDQKTWKTKLSGSEFTVFHLAASKYAKMKASKWDIGRTASAAEQIESLSRPHTRFEKLKEETFRILDYFLMCQPEQIENVKPVIDCKLGTILHYFAAMDYFEGTRLILSTPFSHPPDVKNNFGVTPLLIALNHGHLQTPKELLQYDIDVENVHPLRGNQSALQLLINEAGSINDNHLDVVQSLLDKGANPSRTYDDLEYPPVSLATWSVKLMEKFLDHLDESSINTADRDTGDTLMHYVQIFDDQEKILKILEKGGDVMARNDIPESNLNRSSDHLNLTIKSTKGLRYPKISKLPVQVALYNNTGNAYIQALKSFGLKKVLDNLCSINRKNKELGNVGKCKVLEFLQTHLTVYSLEKEHDMLLDLLRFLKSSEIICYNLPPNYLGLVIHYHNKGPNQYDVTFTKTALNWANENNDRVTAMELVKLEKYVHSDKFEGLQCLKRQLSNDSLLPWIIETYEAFFDIPWATRYLMAIFSVFIELVLLSYVPYIYDIYTDWDLSETYRKVAFENTTQFFDNMWKCSGSNLGQEFNQDLQLKLRHSFLVAFWLTRISMCASLIIYVIGVIAHSNPRIIAKWRNYIQKAALGAGMSPFCVNVFCSIFTFILVLFFKIFWPLVHIGRKIRHEASDKKAKDKAKVMESEGLWNIVKTIEYGLEACLQLILQLWLLKPFYAAMNKWDAIETVDKTLNGIVNFVTFNQFPACYIEKALGKVFLTFVSLAMSIAIFKSTKRGSNACDHPFRMFPILTSVILQILGRLFAFRILLLAESDIGEYKLLIFFCCHFFVVFFIKGIFELQPRSYDCSQKTLLLLTKYFIGCLSSSIVFVRFETPNSNNSFMSQAFFHLLILLEHIFIVILPFIPKNVEFNEEDITIAYTILLLWIFSVLFLCIHYTWSHSWASLNGPNWRTKKCVTIVCCKKNVQQIWCQNCRIKSQDYSDSNYQPVESFAENGSHHIALKCVQSDEQCTVRCTDVAAVKRL